MSSYGQPGLRAVASLRYAGRAEEQANTRQYSRRESVDLGLTLARQIVVHLE